MRFFILILVTSITLCANAQDIKVFKIAADSVVFENIDKKIEIGGTFTYPIGKSHFPTIIIISGTGKQDRNGNMAGHMIFEQIAAYLGQHGIATLRTDDRGVGKTTGVYETSTTFDFAMDALAAVGYLKLRKDVDPGKIGLMGHSEGGAVISIAAAESKDVKFLISLAGLAMGGLDAQLKQNEDLVNTSALPDHDKKRSNEINAIMFRTAFRYAKSDSLEQRLNEAYGQWKVKDDAYFKTLNIQFDHFRFPIYSYVQNAKGAWYRYFIQYNAEETIKKIKVPILAINGDRDLMVAPDENLANWKKYALAGGNRNVTTAKIPSVNHLMLPCTKCDNAEVSKIQSGVARPVLDIISDWLVKYIK